MSKITAQTQFRAGEYSVVVSIGTGTAKLQIEVNDNGALTSPIDVEGADWSASATQIIKLPACHLTPVLTGDAEIFIDEVRRL
jgi:hypothetical protein